jgi:hypothetical protein
LTTAFTRFILFTPAHRTGREEPGMRGAPLLVLVLLASTNAFAQSVPLPSGLSPTCEFLREADVMRLAGDCVAVGPVEVPDGMTLDGDGRTIFAVDPAPDAPFPGPVIVARGSRASVVNTGISTIALANVCPLQGASRLRGIYFEGASGVIRGNVVDNVNRGAGCEEGIAIEVRGSGETVATVVVAHNTVSRYQKSGIIVSGKVQAVIEANTVGASAVQRLLAANGIQAGPAALVRIERNVIVGNSFELGGDADPAGTAILLVETAPGSQVVGNTVTGNADVGIYIRANSVTISGNTLADSGKDGAHDVGIVNAGLNNLFRDNVVEGFRSRWFSMPGNDTGVRRAERRDRPVETPLSGRAP